MNHFFLFHVKFFDPLLFIDFLEHVIFLGEGSDQKTAGEDEQGPRLVGGC